MRNLKKLLAVVVAICVLATFTVPAFAETKTDAQVATDLGVIKGAGSGVTADYLATTPDRVQGAIMFLRLKGLEDTAKAFIGTDNFADVDGLNDTNQAILAYLKANPDLGFAGVGDNKFSPSTKMTAKEYTKVMLVALGYTYETDFTWANVLSFAATKGLVKNIDKVDAFTVNDLCVATVEALGTAVKGGTDKLIAKLVDGGSITSATAVASGLYSATPKALEVVSATTDNLLVAKIVFNQELDSKTVTTSNISATGLDTVTLAADKKTVIAKLATNVAQEKALDFTIENVKSAAGVAITKVVKSVTFRDVTIPVVSGVVAKNAKTLVITASEPMNYVKTFEQPLNSIKIDGAAAFGKTAVDYEKNTITVNLYTAMATGTHKIDMADLTDYAGYKAVATSFNVDVAADTKAPVLTSAKMNNLKEIEVTFDEDLATVGDFYVGSTSTTAVLTKTQSATDGSKVTLGLANDLDIGAVVEIKVEYKGQKDVTGNEVTTKTAYTFKVADDTALPTVTAAIGDGNKITLTFSKTMYATGTIKILKASDSTQIGNTMTVGAAGATFKADTNNTIIELAAADTGLQQKDPTDVKINITGMKDATVRQNVLAEQNLAVKLLDTKTPVVGAFYKTGTTDAADTTPFKKDYITFFFTEAMNTDSISALANYIENGVGALTTISDAKLKEVASDGKSVSFFVPGINHQTTATFTVYAVKDLAGNTQSVTNNVAAATSLADFAVSGSAIATDKRTIKVEFNREIGSMDYTGFVAKKADGTVIGYGGTGSITTTQATITMYQDLPTDTSGVALYFTSNAKNVKDVYGNEVKVAGVTPTDGVLASAALVDKIKPIITVDAGTTAGSITLKFSEKVNMSGALTDNLRITKGSDTADLSATGVTVTYLNGTAASSAGGTFDQIVIEGLAKVTTYNLAVYDVNITDYLGGNKAAVVLPTNVTTK